MSVTPPRLPDPGPEYQQTYMNGLLRVLDLFFNRITAVQPVRATTLNIDLDRLPTEADVAALRTGDVYRDTTAGDVLKIKT